ncbi:hypothetical protein IMCC26134_01345 [Verrucomicrobia bacterium IMCC26134]|nr:hypothetical protein IMCC26134_01345 [Verrucomicrobia bacterium IMCC26134]
MTPSAHPVKRSLAYLKLTAALALTGALGTAHAAYQAVETFNNLNTGALGGQNGWAVSTESTTAAPAVAADPADAVNKVLAMAGVRDAAKALPTAIADASGGTLFYRIRIGGLTNDVSFGLSYVNPASLTAFTGYEIQGNITGTNGNFGSRDGATNRSPLLNLVANSWYNVWYVINTTADSYQLYVQRDGDATYATQTQIASSDGTWNFRNASAASALTSFVILSNSATTNIYFDDIYVDTSVTPNLTNPALAAVTDADLDGLNDTWEIFYFGNTSSQNGAGDPDADGFTNEQEETASSVPNNLASTPSDIDADGLTDTWEVTYFVNRTAQSGSGDPDGDGASNLQEQAAGTNPANAASAPDSDADGLNDAWEIRFFGTIAAQNGSGDADSDGASNAAEMAAGSSPTNVNWTPTQAVLANRWSFDGNLTDSVGGSNATIVDPDANSAVGGTVTQTSTAVTLTGGASTSSAAVKLGTSLLSGKTAPVTLEFWAAQNAVQNWGRIFDFGSSTTEYLFMSWTRGTAAAQDRAEWVDGVNTGVSDTVLGYTLGTKYHIVLTLTPAAYTGGSLASGTRVTWYVASAVTTTGLSAKGTFDTANTLANLNDVNNWLGRSMWASDNVAAATYDEVRIWNGALTNDAINTYQLAGPNSFTFVDTDADGLSDPWETAYFGDLTKSGTADPDSDGFTNAAEYTGGSNPTVTASIPSDVDGDGLPDNWEISYFGNLAQSAAADPDADGATNLQEYNAGSVPNSNSSYPDTDFDGLNDAWEIRYFGNLDSGLSDDPDDDGYDNYTEQFAGTNPADYRSSGDSDADGLPDGWEIHYFKLAGETGLANSSAILARQATADDPDADGFTNLQEYNLFTDPALQSSIPGDINNDGVSDGTVLITGDIIGTTSFNTGLNWKDAATPLAGANYVVALNGLRTPATGDVTFAGDKLILTTAGTNVGTLIWKTTGAATFPILQFDGGMINQAATTAAVAINGSVLVTKPSTLWANNGAFLVNAPISGTGNLTLTGGNLVTFAGVNPHTGNLTVSNTAGFTLASSGAMKFVLGAPGVNNAVTGTGPVVFNGAFSLDVTGASATLGDTWLLITTSGAKTYGASFSVTGYVTDGAAVGARKWSSLGSAPFYRFDEATGTVTVVTNPDADNDGLTDAWEISNFGDLSHNGSADTDSDGSTDAAEFTAGTNPILDTSWPDTDADGVKDSWELATFGNLATATITDKDGDTLLDTWELTYFASITTQNGTTDSDSDTFDNLAEQAARSNPALAASVPGDINGDGVADGHRLLTGDTVGTTSFNAGLNWEGTVTPATGENYFVDVQSLRTPADALDYTFAGNHLVIFTGGNLLVKGTGIITLPNGVLDGGRLHNATNGNVVATIAGAINVRSASEIYTQNGGITITAALSGTGNLVFTGPNPVTFAGTNTYKGSLSLLNTAGFTLASTGTLTFAPAANGITNAITGTNPAFLNGTFSIDTSATSTVSGSSWVLVATSGAKTYGATFTVNGFTADAGALGARKWTSGSYQYDEATSTLSVTAPPLSALQSWRVIHFGDSANSASGANNADPDGDGRSNLLEYALGSDPMAANTNAPVTLSTSGSFLTLAFNTIADPSLSYVVQASSDLSTWAPAQTYTGLSSAGTITYTDTTTLGSTTRRFLRLSVSAQ